MLLIQKNNVYETFLTDIEFEYMSTTTFSNSTESPARNNADYFSQAGAAYRKAREELSKQKTEWEKAMEDLSGRLENSSGLYMTEEKQSDGSSIYYMHDKPTKEQSKIVCKMTAEAMAVSTDGGKTWNAGLTVDGTLIAKILNAIGINADWINSGDMSADRIYGGTLTLGGKDNKHGTLQVLDSDGEVRGVWDYLTLKLKDKSGSVARPAMQVISAQNNNETTISGGYFRVKYNQKDMFYISDDLDYVSATKLQTYGLKSTGDAEMMRNLTVGLHVGCSTMDANSAKIISFDTKWVKASDAIWSQNFFVYSGGTKAKVASTKNFGDRVQHCYETSSPYFGDIGQGYLDTNGMCRIYIEDVFLETINTECEYQVFLQKEGKGDIWVEEKEALFFTVKGTPGLKFAWELKGIQRGFEARRLDRVEVESDERKDIDYALNAAKFYEEIQHNNYAGEGYSFYMNYINDLRRQYYA